MLQPRRANTPLIPNQHRNISPVWRAKPVRFLARSPPVSCSPSSKSSGLRRALGCLLLSGCELEGSYLATNGSHCQTTLAFRMVYPMIAFLIYPILVGNTIPPAAARSSSEARFVGFLYPSGTRRVHPYLEPIGSLNRVSDPCNFSMSSQKVGFSLTVESRGDLRAKGGKAPTLP